MTEAFYMSMNTFTGEVLSFYTIPQLDTRYGDAYISVMDRSDITLNVMSCQGAYIALSTIPQNTDTLTYEIKMDHMNGGIVTIHDSVNGTEVARAESLSLGICDKSETYWISWLGTTVKMGAGSVVGENEVITYDQFKLTSVTTVSIASGFGDQKGTWEYTVIPSFNPGNIKFLSRIHHLQNQTMSTKTIHIEHMFTQIEDHHKCQNFVSDFPTPPTVPTTTMTTRTTSTATTPRVTAPSTRSTGTAI